jgi:hypothetical protein
MSLLTRFTTRNVGTIDRLVRTLPAIAFAYVYATGALAGAALIGLGIIAAMLLVTSVSARCSIYALFGLSTCPLQKS